MADRGEEAKLMGMLFTRKHKRGDPKLKFRRWKINFWVANFHEKRIDFFKSDQALIRKGSIDVREIVNVTIVSDRSSKFFCLTVELHRGDMRQFRMNSREERDRWYIALLEMMKTMQSNDKLSSVVSTVRRRLTEWSAELKLKITADLTVLAELPASLIAWYIAGLEAGVTFVRQLKDSLSQASFGTHSLETVCVTVRAASDKTDIEAASEGTRYEPVEKSLTLLILLVRESVSGLRFLHVDLQSALGLLHSTVWRDPKFEGWLVMDEGAIEFRNRIASLLQVPDFHIRIQWGHNVQRDTAAVQPYFVQYINVNLLRNVHNLFASICAEDEGSFDQASAASCMQRCVTGLSVMIDSTIIHQNEPPELLLEHTMWQEASLSAAFAVTAQLRSRGGATPLADGPLSELRGQINDVILHVRIANSCRKVEQALCDTGVRDGVVVKWERMAIALRSLDARIHETLLPRFIQELTSPLLERLMGLISKLKKSDQLSVFFSCISCIRIGFQTLREPIVPPSVFMGNFSECMILCDTDRDAVTCRDLFDMPLSVLPHFPRNGVVFSVPFLSSWFKGFFALPSNIVAAPLKELLDVFEGDSGSSEGEDDDWGENAAVQRSEEAKVLRRCDAANLIYDGQGSELAFKVSADLIERAIGAVEAAFPGFAVQMHDVVRVISQALKRLRQLADNSPFDPSAISRDQALSLLEEWCEFEESCAEIDTLVTAETTFQGAAEIGLLSLLPIEVKLATRSRRDVILVGLQNTGKTLITNMLRNIHVPTLPTIGVTTTVVAYREWVFALREIGGRQEFRRNWQHYLAMTEPPQGAIFVVDAANRLQLVDATQYFTDMFSSSCLRGIPVLLLVNNTTAEKGLPRDQIERIIDLATLAANKDQLYFACECDVTMHRAEKAVLDMGVRRGFDWLCGAMRTVSSPEMLPAMPRSLKGMKQSVSESSVQ